MTDGKNNAATVLIKIKGLSMDVNSYRRKCLSYVMDSKTC